MRGSLSRLRLAILLNITIVTTGVLGYRFLEDHSWLEALYMTVITLTTAGFREVKPLGVTGQLFTIGLLVAGVGIVFYTAVTIVGQVVEGEFQQVFGRRRMQKRIETLTHHYLVCGFGRIGEILCRELASKPVPFVVIEQQEERVREAEAAQYLVLRGDATQEQVLEDAGVKRATGLFATLTKDAGNVFVTLTAKELNPSVFVVARAETEKSERTLLRAGADKVISPYAMGGHRMAQAALRPAVVDIIDLATHYQGLELQLEEISIPAHSPCDGTTLRDSGLSERSEVIVVALKRAEGQMFFNPAPQEKLQAGDSIIVLAEATQLKEIEKRIKGQQEQ